MAAEIVCRRYVVRGRVQGVGFRYFAQRLADRTKVTGWVRNLADGTVEAHAQGSAAAVSEFAAGLWVGPRFAEVRGVDASDAAPELCEGFRVRG